MAEPRFRVFDVVEVPRDSDWTPGEWAVVQVRVYDDGRIAYAVTNIGDDNGYIIDEAELAPTDRRVDASPFEIPGPVKHRDVVVIDPDYEDDEVAGQWGEVMGWSGGRGEAINVLVWLNALGEAAQVPLKVVTPTGGRGPAPIVPRRMTSTLVSHDGRSDGTVGYVVVDDLDAHL